MSKTLDKYFITRLEKAENHAKYVEQINRNINEELNDTIKRLNILVDLFERRDLDNGKYYYGLKGCTVSSTDHEAYDLLDKFIPGRSEVEDA